MRTRTGPCFALALCCACVSGGPVWAQHHGGGSHAGGSLGFHPGGGGQSSFRPSAPLPAPRPSLSPYHGPSAPPPSRTSWRFASPGRGFQHFRSSSAIPAPGSRVRQGGIPRSAYLATRNWRYSSQAPRQLPSAAPGRSLSASPRGIHLAAGSRAPLAPMHYGHPHFPRHPHVLPPQSTFFTNLFLNSFFFGTPFFFSPFWFSPFVSSWYYYPPLTFSDTSPSQGCPYEDYYYQRPRYNEPEQETTEQAESAPPPTDGTEEAVAPPSEAQQAQTAPFSYETPLPDVIEWGKASEVQAPRQVTPTAKGPLVVNLPHHTLTILPNNPGPSTTGP